MAIAFEPKKRKKSTDLPIGEPTWDVAQFYPLQGFWTEEDYFALESNSGNRLIELNDGVLEFLPIPDMFHQDIVQFLFLVLSAFLKDHAIGRVYVSPLPVKLWTDQIREPDVVFLKSRRIKDKRKAPKGADLVMEVVSPGSKNRKRDLNDKRHAYAKAKIPEYWIVDPKTNTITILVLTDGRYTVHGEFSAGDQATSKLLKGFTVDVAEVFAAGEKK